MKAIGYISSADVRFLNDGGTGTVLVYPQESYIADTPIFMEYNDKEPLVHMLEVYKLKTQQLNAKLRDLDAEILKRLQESGYNSHYSEIAYRVDDFVYDDKFTVEALLNGIKNFK